MSGQPFAQHASHSSGRTLVLCDGDLPSYHAAWAARERAISEGPAASPANASSMPVMAPFGVPTIVEPMEHAVALQARALGLTSVATITSHAMPEDLPGHAESIALLNACYAAVRLGCDRVVYPASACTGESIDLDRMAAIADRAVLVARLCSLDSLAHHTPGIRIETPYVDLTDLQLADLLLDAELSPQALWWWGGSSEPARASLARWMRALEPMGFRV